MKAAPLNNLPPHPLDDHARAQIDLALARYQSQPGPLLQVLHAVQASLGYVPPAAVPLIAQALNLSRAEVHGVITFYHHFRSAPPGRHTIQLCQAEACRSMHCEVLTEHAKRTLGIDFHGTTADGRFTLEPVYCLGNCACGPAMMVDGDLHGRVTPESFDALLAEQALPQ
jgi:formate dehydrogenase subunit gamma